LLFELGDFAGAAGQAAQLLQQQPGNAKALQLLGMSRLKLDRIEEGVRDLEEALRLDPGNRSAAYTLGTAYVSGGDLPAAERLIETMLRGEQSAEAHMIRGAVHKSRQRYIEAIEELEAACRMNPRLDLAHELLGGTYLLVGDFERAKETYGRVLAADPESHWANINLGWIHIRHREYDQAAPYVRTAYRLQPDDIEVLHMMGQIEQVEGKYEEAREKLERVAAARPQDKSVHVLLSRIYLKLGRREDFNREKAIIQRLGDEEQKQKLDALPQPPGPPSSTGRAPAPATPPTWPR
jgi:tetratricopeptide (TPR) repeat protein